MNNDEPSAVRHARCGLQATLIGLVLSYVGVITLEPWSKPDPAKSSLLFLIGLTIAAFSQSLRAIGRYAAAIQTPRPWIKPVASISAALGTGLSLLAVAYLLF
jgi:hypothetical protein